MFFSVEDVRSVCNTFYEVPKYWGTYDDVKFGQGEIIGVPGAKNDVRARVIEVCCLVWDDLIRWLRYRRWQ